MPSWLEDLREMVNPQVDGKGVRDNNVSGLIHRTAA
jgi:hypothetical protein